MVSAENQNQPLEPYRLAAVGLPEGSKNPPVSHPWFHEETRKPAPHLGPVPASDSESNRRLLVQLPAKVWAAPP